MKRTAIVTFSVAALSLACSPPSSDDSNANDTAETPSDDSGGSLDVPSSDTSGSDTSGSDTAGGACSDDGQCPSDGLGPCQVPHCADGVCGSLPAADGSACDDANLCTTSDRCEAGTCAGTAVSCPGASGCQGAATCDAGTGQCVSSPVADGTACDDGDLCTAVDTCSGGACVGGQPVSCQATACREAGTCDAATGACTGAPKADGTACDDGNACTSGDACAAGQCAGGEATVCPGGPCAAGGICNPLTGACGGEAKPDGASCDDGDVCTTDETCAAGECVGKPLECPTGPCVASATCEEGVGCVDTPADDGTECDDGDACTSGEVCTDGACGGGDPVVCAPGGPCRSEGVCDTKSGFCFYDDKADGSACEDGSACTHDDLCQGGSCVGTPVVCGDATLCHQAPVCDPDSGDCVAADQPDGSACDDGDACTTDDGCVSGVCKGSAVECPAPAACHAPALCDGATGECSSAVLDDGSSCDDGQACTVNDACDGGACAGQPVVCPEPDQCHLPGVCDPTDGACDSEAKADGASCDDGNPCTVNDSCASGVCVGTPVVCEALDGCHVAGVCNPTTGACSHPTKDDGSACDDQNNCTTGDQCTLGVCAGAAVVCTALDQCHTAGVCEAATGACTQPTKSDGVSCDDGNACTTTDVCTAGVCGGAAVVCAPSDACHVAGTCDPSNGQCSNPPAANGLACSDGSACTTGDSCQAGVCKGAPVLCTALDQCHSVGTCEPSTGLCSQPAKADGAACSDGDACTHTDKCQAGACVGVATVCTAADECHDGGVCDPSTGACTGPAKPDGTACDDHNACTADDACTDGECGGEATVCTALDGCHVAGECDPDTGVCSDPPGNDGAPCTDDNLCTLGDVCAAGACVGTPESCITSQQCRLPGTCDPLMGGCDFPMAPDGASCDDGNPCTINDTCTAGGCAGTPVVCTALDGCHDAGFCNPDTGACTQPVRSDGTPCSDGNACTHDDICFAGVCSGDVTVCEALDNCHTAGSCDPLTGGCSHPAKPNGSACDDGNPCTLDDACQAGACAGPTPKDCGPLGPCDAALSCVVSGGAAVCQRTPKVDGSTCDDGDLCTTADVCTLGVCGGEAKACAASDACHVAGQCNPATGQCSDPAAPDGTACDDGEPCSVSDACLAGQCTAGPPMPCPSTDPCTLDGVCDPASGTCVNPPAEDGQLCTDDNPCTQVDTCSSGVCVGSDPLICRSDNPCTVAGECNPLTGECGDAVPKEDGSTCDDGSLCTADDVCMAGTCTGDVLACPPSDGCSLLACNGATGACEPADTAPDGASCDDGNLCTQNDSCTAGVCTSGEPLHCPPTQQCQGAGSCNPATGQCVIPNLADGTACNDFAACTSSEVCAGGQCPAAECTAPPLAITGILITEFRTRGPAGGNDEFVEITNTSLNTVVIGGFKLMGASSSGTAGTSRATIPAGRTLAPGASYLLTNSASGPYSGAVPGNQTYGSGIADNGGLAIVDASNNILDQVGMSTTTVYKEGSPLAQTTSNVEQSYRRYRNGAVWQDTNNNLDDFNLIAVTTPTNNTWSAPVPAGVFFGGVVGVNTVKVVGSSNLLSVAADVTGAAIEGGTPGVFVTTQPSPTTVAAGGVMSVFVTFNAPAAGSYSAQLRIDTSAETLYVPLIGVAVE